eukprot:2832192-Pleurochrysis_carterae.AAC.4
MCRAASLPASFALLPPIRKLLAPRQKLPSFFPLTKGSSATLLLLCVLSRVPSTSALKPRPRLLRLGGDASRPMLTRADKLTENVIHA